MNAVALSDLCLECGLCCNGVIFANVRLQSGDDPARLQALGLVAKSARNPRQFAQPCRALEGCRCRVYADRPTYCRQFECLLLKQVNTGETSTESARAVIRRARRRADKVKRLLRSLGDVDEQVALGVRFRRMQKRYDKGASDPAATEVFGRLTLAMHDLNLLLSASFYSGPV